MTDTIRLLHLADLHLDHPFAWAPLALARQRRQAIRDALERALAIARSERVDAVLCAGDLFDLTQVTPDSIAFLVAALGRLAPIPVLVAPGNHDWYGPQTPYAQASWPANVTIFRTHELTPVPVAAGFTVWGAAHLAPAGTPDLLAGARAEGPGVHVGLVHAAESRDHHPLDGSGLLPDPHAPFEPQEVRRAGLLHLCAGHYHTPRDQPLYTYPGNPEALSFVHREGDRGVVLHTFDTAGRHERTRFVVDSGTLFQLRLDVTGCASQQDVRARVASELHERHGVVRVDLEGELPPEVALDPGALEDCAPWLDALLCRDAGVRLAYDVAALARDQTVRGQFVRDVTEAADVEERLRERVLTIGLRALEGREDLDPAGASCGEPE
ncbi:MAG: metallophosphoesterase [Candidatus Dormibacteraeota bacterium]|nr:metallophosphoesterase [Candidatus Dormibacteraeota bacterium]